MNERIEMWEEDGRYALRWDEETHFFCKDKRGASFHENLKRLMGTHHEHWGPLWSFTRVMDLGLRIFLIKGEVGISGHGVTVNGFGNLADVAQKWIAVYMDTLK